MFRQDIGDKASASKGKSNNVFKLAEILARCVKHADFDIIMGVTEVNVGT